MNLDDTIFVAGHRGMVGSCLVRTLKAAGYTKIVTTNGDLTDQRQTRSFFSKPGNWIQYVFLAAAKVGGIQANRSQPVDFLLKNLLIQNNVIEAAADFGIKKLLFFGSSCAYPRLCPQPMKEEYLLTGPLEPTNESYAMAKIAGIKLCRAYQIEKELDFISVMPTNLYGPGDRYSTDSHVIPALIKRFHEAKVAGKELVTVWGYANTRREFLFVTDLVDAAIRLMKESATREQWINIGYGKDVTIRELAEHIKKAVGLTAEIRFDESKPVGTPRKWLDSTRIFSTGWKPQVDLPTGIGIAYHDFLQRWVVPHTS